jgi:DNA-binding GntR family transcriptional regulator
MLSSCMTTVNRCGILVTMGTPSPPIASLQDPDTAALPRPRLARVRRPLADEVRDAVEQELILSGAVPPGARLPTEAELCDRYGVSRITVRAALRSLQDAGYISTRQGKGSTVLPRPETIMSGIDQLCSFETFAAKQSQAVESADVEIEEIRLDVHEAGKLGVPAGTPALAIRRTKLYGGTKVGWIADYVPDGVLPFPVLAAEFAGSVLDVLLAHHELEVDHSDCELRAVALTGDLAHQLDVRTGTAALLIDELTRTSSGRIIDWSQAWLLPEHFRFLLRRR